MKTHLALIAAALLIVFLLTNDASPSASVPFAPAEIFGETITIDGLVMLPAPVTDPALLGLPVTTTLHTSDASTELASQ